MADGNGTEKSGAAYVPWGTFKNSLDRLSQGVPNRVDRSAFPGLAGGTQSQLLTALKFLRLIHDDWSPTEALRALVSKDELERKEELKKAFLAAYAEVVAIDLEKATPAELQEKMTECYGVSGSTLRKAVSFFLAGARDLGIPTSPYLQVKKGPNGGPRRRRTPKPRANEVKPEVAPVAPVTSGTSKTVRLDSGGTLTLSATLDLFSLKAGDRRFVFDLIDKLEEYELTLGKPAMDTPPGAEVL